MGATDGKLELKFHVPLKLGRGENNREARGQRIGRIQRERQAVHLCWPKMLALRAPRALLEAVQVFVPVRTPCIVTLIRVAPARGKQLDETNLRGALKATQDEVAAILGRDDADPEVKWRFRQQRGEWGVWVSILATLKGPEVVAPKASMSAPRQKHSEGPKTKAPLAVRRGLDRKVAAFLGAKPAFVPPPGRTP